jgi:hypothetical protein
MPAVGESLDRYATVALPFPCLPVRLFNRGIAMPPEREKSDDPV